jgi:hypothetical protein
VPEGAVAALVAGQAAHELLEARPELGPAQRDARQEIVVRNANDVDAGDDSLHAREQVDQHDDQPLADGRRGGDRLDHDLDLAAGNGQGRTVEG